ncbi:molybdate ABC transporter substrate-binding protein [Prosthecochloris sp.]|uniref:molybdate ABC transporter substrate-binding protein n=1 Tax=Prosthecochloris sp. TaxID=290513 RepID=UPI00257D2628|nr:molybdate ABC transporter substrate-binding protein [Prosthecochloris sp.]
MIQKKTAAVLLILLLLGGTVFAGEITVASGAGYKQPLLEIIALYEKKSGRRITPVFGNMSHLISQATLSGNVALILGDRKFLDHSGLNFSSFHHMGHGKLVLAYRKGITLGNVFDITRDSIARIGMPDSAKAMYGNAAAEFLNSSALMKKVHKKILRFASVPQVSTYLMTGEIDAGFINLTDALWIKEKIGGYIPVNEKTYSAVTIEVGILREFENDPDVKTFTSFLQTEEVSPILSKYGML